ncbi:MAG: threonine--tRNA ligase [Candidatus Bathyarchaeia archaeon]
MRLLFIHADSFGYKVLDKAIERPEALEGAEREASFHDVLVVFTTVEQADEDSPAEVVTQAAESVLDVAVRVGAHRLVLYPYAHLSSQLASPSHSLSILKAMEERLKESGVDVHRSPFGWYKAFTIACKGHPLSELSRTIVGAPGTSGEPTAKRERVSKALQAEEKLQSSWFILDPEGRLTPVSEFDFQGSPNLEKLARYEMAKVRAVAQVPPHVTLMKRLEIAAYEPGSDPGNMRWYPKGALMKRLLEQFVARKVAEYGAMEVETPVMYDAHHPSLASYLDRFPARQYMVESEDRELFLRFSACFGQFLLASDAQISYRQLPLKLYELTRYSFRREKSGELVGLRRLRAFTMPDCHALCADLDQARVELVARFQLSMSVLSEGLGLKQGDYELAVRFTKDFYEENRGLVHSLVRLFGRPALVEMWPERFFYFTLKWEFNFVDALEKASALSTDQVDVENAERYGIVYVDEKGEKRFPLILHCSPSGAIERDIYALLERAYLAQQRGETPTLPLWLQPTQIRLIPVSEKALPDVEKVAEEIEGLQVPVRVDIDDRPVTVDRKVRDAELEWIEYILVVGPREVKSGIFTVRKRSTREMLRLPLKELADAIKAETEGKPFLPQTLSKYLSKRPQFPG